MQCIISTSKNNFNFRLGSLLVILMYIYIIFNIVRNLKHLLLYRKIILIMAHITTNKAPNNNMMCFLAVVYCLLLSDEAKVVPKTLDRNLSRISTFQNVSSLWIRFIVCRHIQNWLSIKQKSELDHF